MPHFFPVRLPDIELMTRKVVAKRTLRQYFLSIKPAIHR